MGQRVDKFYFLVYIPHSKIIFQNTFFYIYSVFGPLTHTQKKEKIILG